MGLDLVEGVEQRLFVVRLRCFDRTVEFGVDLLRKFVGERVERLRHRLLFAEDRNFELFADLLELGVDFGNGLHIDSRIDPQFLAEDVDQLDSRRSRTAAEVPAVGIDDIDSCDDRRQHRCQTVARGAVGVEIDGDIQILLEELHQFAHAVGREQTRHILDRDHIGSQRLHLLGFREEVFVREYRLRVLLAHQFAEEPDFRIFRIDRITYRTVGDTAVLLHVFYGRFNVIHVVQGIEDTHDAQAALNRVTAEAVDDFVRIGGVSEEVAAARKGRELRYVSDCLVNGFQAGPGIFVQVAHYRVGHCAAPNFHGVKVRILVERKAAVDLGLVHSCSERRLLAVTQRKISDF